MTNINLDSKSTVKAVAVWKGFDLIIPLFVLGVCLYPAAWIFNRLTTVTPAETERNSKMVKFEELKNNCYREALKLNNGRRLDNEQIIYCRQWANSFYGVYEH